MNILATLDERFAEGGFYEYNKPVYFFIIGIVVSTVLSIKGFHNLLSQVYQWRWVSSIHVTETDRNDLIYESVWNIHLVTNKELRVL